MIELDARNNCSILLPLADADDVNNNVTGYFS